MDTPTGELIEARRQAGLSYSIIGEELGITKDAARGLHTRWLGNRVADAVPALGEQAPAARRRRAVGNSRRAAGVPAYVGVSVSYFKDGSVLIRPLRADG